MQYLNIAFIFPERENNWAKTHNRYENTKGTNINLGKLKSVMTKKTGLNHLVHKFTQEVRVSNKNTPRKKGKLLSTGEINNNTIFFKPLPKSLK